MLPNVLVIGGMKCGSTTLHHDLNTHPGLFVAEKELNALVRTQNGLGEVRDRYSRAFRGAPTGKLRVDVSTTYSMLPDLPEASDNARRLLADNTKVLYVVRHPVKRAISHHHHMHTWHGEGKIGPDINDCVPRHPSIIDYGRYMTQLRPWLLAFGEANVKVLLFEQYIADRQSTLESVWEFLGIDAPPRSAGFGRARNKSDGKPVLNPFWARVQGSRLYQEHIRPKIPQSLKERVMRALLPAAPAAFASPSDATLARIVEASRPEEQKLREWMGREHPLWDLDASAHRTPTDSRAA